MGSLAHKLPILCALVLVGLAPACSDDPTGIPPANVVPHIRVTGAPSTGAVVTFKQRIFWHGWDDDGIITRYEYAVDPPDAFTTDEIRTPEAFPGIVTEFRPGFEQGTGRVLVSKEVDGERHEFFFTVTPRTDVEFILETPDPDSIPSSQGFRPTRTSSGSHRIYVRALDDDGAYSRAERIAFDARSLAPSAYITFPRIQGDRVLFTGTRLLVSLFGYDPDPPDASFRPAAFLYKLIRVDELQPKRSVFSNFNLERLVYSDAADIPWNRVSADSADLELFLNPGQYVFAARAIDRVGAVEPFIDWDRAPENPGNAFRFIASETGGLPDLSIRCAQLPKLAQFPFRGTTKVFRDEVPVFTDLEFDWTASAQEYGGRIDAYSWGLDVADLEAEGAGSGWSPWGAFTRTPEPIRFRLPGPHVLYVRARDTNGAITLGTVVIRAFPVPLNRGLLVVDDYLNERYPSDGQHDAWWRDRLVETGRFTAEEVSNPDMWFETGGAGDRRYLKNEPPPLSRLVLHESVLWIVQGTGWCGMTGLLRSGVLTEDLRTWLGFGGKLWVVGTRTLTAMTRAEFDCNDPRSMFYRANDPTTPAGEHTMPLRFEAGHLAQDIFKLATDQAENAGTDNGKDTLVGVRPHDPANPEFGPMNVDSTRFTRVYWESQALAGCDAIFDPVFTSRIEGYRGVVDSLYRYVDAASVRPINGVVSGSRFRDRLCATRWHDPDPAREHGRVMWFGFPLYYMHDAEAVPVIRKALEWLDDEIPRGPVEDSAVAGNGFRR